MVETITYNRNDTYIDVVAPSGENDKRRQYEYDGLGRLASVCEVTGGVHGWPGGNCGQKNPLTGYWTTYSYTSNATGPALTVTQNAQATTGQQQRIFQYDWLGRLTSEKNPESGITTYVYDSTSTPCNGGGPTGSNGDLMMRTDASHNCSVYFYDALHRVTDVGNNLPSATNPCRRFRYDNHPGYKSSTPPGTLTNTMGRLMEAATDRCRSPTPDTILTNEWFSYGPRGPLAQAYESTPNSGGYYESVTAYAPNYAVGSIGLYNGAGTALIPTLSRGLDGEGRPNSELASLSQNPVTAVNYVTANNTGEPVGALTSVTYGSQDSDTFQYNPNTGRMTQYSLNVNGQSDVENLTWNPNGTLQKLAITNPFNSLDNQTCTNAFDDLARISGNSCGGTWGQTFSYDPFGNISKTGSATWLPNYNNSQNQYVQGWNGVAYDPGGNGNLLNDSFNSYTWDVYGDMASANGVTATYDAFGRMVEVANAASNPPVYQLVYSPAGGPVLAQTSSQGLLLALVPLPGGGSALYNTQYSGTSVAYYAHADWLGSTRMMSDPSRNYEFTMAYAPFGEQYGYTGPWNYVTFTTGGYDFTVNDGHNQSGTLDDFMFCRYSPGQRTWISPDPAGLAAVDPTNPQTWNRYAYVANNPLSFVDPLGF